MNSLNINQSYDPELEEENDNPYLTYLRTVDGKRPKVTKQNYAHQSNGIVNKLFGGLLK